MKSEESFQLTSLLQQTERFDEGYLQFIQRDSLRAGVYVLEAGATDPQEPHREDEMYYVVSGQATFARRAGDWRYEPVNSGSLLFVAAGDEHHFCEIKERLVVVVFFASKPT